MLLLAAGLLVTYLLGIITGMLLFKVFMTSLRVVPLPEPTAPPYEPPPVAQPAEEPPPAPEPAPPPPEPAPEPVGPRRRQQTYVPGRWGKTGGGEKLHFYICQSLARAGHRDIENLPSQFELC
eukprot:8054667-Alexandrium_andersonii.AAC.1